MPALAQQDQFARRSRWIEVFNRGRKPVNFATETSVPWVRVSPSRGEVSGTNDVRLDVTVDWAAVPEGRTNTSIEIRGSDGGRVVIAAPVMKQPTSAVIAPGSFLESAGYVAIEAGHYARAVSSEDIFWQILPGFGNTDGGVTPFPVTADSRKLSSTSPRLEYRLQTTSAGEAKVELTVAPTLAFVPGRGLRVAVSFDDAPPRQIDLAIPAGGSPSPWASSVLDGVRKVVTTHQLARPGAHVLKYWMIDPGVVLERVVVDFGGVRPSYLGPPESLRSGR